MCALAKKVDRDEKFENVLTEEAGPGYIKVTGLFKAYRGKWFMGIEKQMTVLQDGSDFDECIREAQRDLVEKDYHDYSSATYLKLLPA